MRIRRGLSSRQLPCGCVAGVYETYRGDIVAVLDVRSSTCENAAHVAGKSVEVPLSVGATASSNTPRD